MKPLPVVSTTPIFVHERTTLYARIRELHAFAAELEIAAGTSRYFGALVHIGLLAMFSTASAGVAPTERTRARHLKKLRDQLARFASALRGMADRGLVANDLAASGTELVRDANSLIDDFGEALLQNEAAMTQDDPLTVTEEAPSAIRSFQDERAVFSRPTDRTSRGARRIRHVEVTDGAPSERVASDANYRGAQASAAQEAAASAHNDERMVPDGAARPAATKSSGRRSRTG
jgi:hypothetical protein